MRDFNSDEYVFFVLDKAHHNNASFGFRAAYTDKQGDFHVLRTNQLDKSTGEKMIRKFTIQKGHKTLRIHKNQDKIIDFLRNHPNCSGSENGSYRFDGKGGKFQQDVWFAEINTERDAEVAVDLRMLRLDAQNAIMALSTSDKDLMEFGRVMGYTGSAKTVLFKLLEHAEKDPQNITAELNSPTMKSKSLFEEGKGAGVIVRKGLTYMVEDFELGIDDDECIKSIQKNSDVATLINRKLGKYDEPSEKLEEVIEEAIPTESKEEESLAEEVNDDISEDTVEVTEAPKKRGGLLSKKSK